MRLPDADDPDRGDARPLAQKLGWMVAIWLMSVGLHRRGRLCHPLVDQTPDGTRKQCYRWRNGTSG